MTPPRARKPAAAPAAPAPRVPPVAMAPPDVTAISSARPADPAFFVPRRWLASQVDRWLGDDAGSGVLILVGPPGTGKSRFVSGWAAELAREGSGAVLGVMVLQDQRADRTDGFSWPALRDQLLGLASASSRPAAPQVTAQASIGSVAEGAEVNVLKVENLVGDLVLGASDPVREMQNLVLPALGRLPPGPAVVVAIDGLDEAYRYQATDYLRVVELLATSVAGAQRSDHGLGRIRLLLTSQPEVPVTLSPAHPAAEIDLAQPDASDREDLRDYVKVLLRDLPSEPRRRLAASIADQADGVWVIAFYAAQAIAEDVAAGAAPPEGVELPTDLGTVYAEVLDRARTRLGARWPTARALLALVAAAQDVTAPGLPRDVAAAALAALDADLGGLLAGTGALVSRGADHTMRFWHGDFGRWVIDGGLGDTAIREAHDRLAQVLAEMSGGGWRLAGSYAARFAGLHALSAAELTVGEVAHGQMVGRCVGLYSDKARMECDQKAGDWLDQLDRLGAICPAATTLGAATEPLGGLATRMEAVLQGLVGVRIAAQMSREQIEEYQRLSDAGSSDAAALLASAVPNHAEIVHEEFRRLFTRILDGERLPADAGDGPSQMAGDYRSEWEQTGQPDALDTAIALYEEALGVTPAGHGQRANRLARLADALGERIGTDREQPGDLDRLLEAQGELVRRDDLEISLAHPAGRPWGVYSYWLGRRWDRDESGHAADLGAAVDAAGRALELTPRDHSDRPHRLIRLANALIDRIGTDAEQPGDLDRIIEVQRELAHRPDLAQVTADPGRIWVVLAHWLGQRLQRDPGGRAADADEAIEAADAALALAPPGDQARADRLATLADALNLRLDTDAEQPGDLDRIVAAQGELVHSDDLGSVVGDPARSWAFHALLLTKRWRRDPAAHPADIDEAVDAAQTALTLTPDDHAERGRRLVRLADALNQRLDTGQERPDDLDRLIAVQGELVRRDDLGDVVADAGGSWALFCELLAQRWRRDPAARAGDLDEAITAAQESLARTPASRPERADRLAMLANDLSRRLGSAAEQPGDLDRCIEAQGELVRRDDLGDVVSDPSGSWSFYSGMLSQRWQRDPAAHAADLDEAVTAAGTAVAGTAAENGDRPARLIRLANALIDRIRTDAEQAGDLDRLIDVQREIAHRPDLDQVVTDPGRTWVVLADWLVRRVRQDPEAHAADADEAVMAAGAALALTPPGDQDRTDRLVTVSDALNQRLGTDAEQPGDLDQIIEVQAELVRRDDIGAVVGDPARSWALYSFWLVQRWRRAAAADAPGTARAADIDEAVTAAQTALELTPGEHAERGVRLIALADALKHRLGTSTEQPGDLDALIEAQAELVRRDDLATVVAIPAESWELLARLLRMRWQRDSRAHPADVHHAVAAAERALALTPDDDPDRSARLVETANALVIRSGAEAEQPGDLDRLIEVQAELVSRPDLAARTDDPGHSWSLYGQWLRRRWERDPAGHAPDIVTAVTALDEALRLAPAGHEAHAARLIAAANAHLLGYLNGVPGASLGTAVGLAAQALRADDPNPKDLLPALRLAARHAGSVGGEGGRP